MLYIHKKTILRGLAAMLVWLMPLFGLSASAASLPAQEGNASVAWQESLPITLSIAGAQGELENGFLTLYAENADDFNLSGSTSLIYELAPEALAAHVLTEALTEVQGPAHALKLSWDSLPGETLKPGVYTFTYASKAISGEEAQLVCTVTIQAQANSSISIPEYSVPLSSGTPEGEGEPEPAPVPEEEAPKPQPKEEAPELQPKEDAPVQAKSAEPVEDSEPASTNDSTVDAPPAPTPEPEPEPEAKDTQIAADEAPVETATEPATTDEPMPTQEPATYIAQFISYDGGLWFQVPVEEGQILAFPSEAPARKGYTFSHWYSSDDEAKAPYGFDQPIAGDIQLYAAFIKNPETISEASATDAATEEENIQEAASPGEALDEHTPIAAINAEYEGEIAVGTPVTLVATVSNIPEGITPTYQWQNNANGEFEDVPGATGLSHSFTADEANTGCQWRLRIILPASNED